MTCKTLAGRAEYTSSRTSPSTRGDIDPGSMKGICNGFRVKPGMTWVWDRVVVVYRLFCPDWIPGQARNDVGMGSGGGCFWIPGQARNDVDVGLVVEVYGLFCPDWIPGQARNDV